MKRFFRCVVIAAVVMSVAPLASHSATPVKMWRSFPAQPRLILWAWERPEDLRFIDPSRVGVGFLAGTIRLSSTTSDIHYRMQPLRVARGTKLIAVVRIEATSDSPLDRRQLQKSAQYLAEVGSLPGVISIQTDFDATVSQREFYRALLAEVRRKIPASTPISITALASWCMGDPWIANLPIEDAVPMMFRLGAGKREVASWFSSARDFSLGVCRNSVGISSDEPWASLPNGRRVFAFSPKAWDQRSLDALYWEMHAWR